MFHVPGNRDIEPPHKGESILAWAQEITRRSNRRIYGERVRENAWGWMIEHDQPIAPDEPVTGLQLILKTIVWDTHTASGGDSSFAIGDTGAVVWDDDIPDDSSQAGITNQEGTTPAYADPKIIVKHAGLWLICWEWRVLQGVGWPASGADGITQEEDTGAQDPDAHVHTYWRYHPELATVTALAGIDRRATGDVAWTDTGHAALESTLIYQGGNAYAGGFRASSAKLFRFDADDELNFTFARNACDPGSDGNVGEVQLNAARMVMLWLGP